MPARRHKRTATAPSTNGHARTLKQQVVEAKLQAELYESKIRAKQLEVRSRLLESATDVSTITDWMTAYSDLISRFRNEPNAFQVSTYNDRRYRRNYPLWQTEVELALIRMGSRIQAQTNPYATGLMRGLRSFVIADAYTYRATSEDDREPDLCKKVQKIIDAHIELNQWCGGEKGSREQELFNNSIMDGEFFLRHFARDDGLTDTRIILPEQVRQPGEWPNEIGMFGIRHAKDDHENPISYWVTYTGVTTEGDEVGANEIIHLPRNRPDRTVARGCPEFAFDTFDALDSANKLSKAMGMGSTIHASIAGVREHQSADKVAVQSFVDSLADYQRPDLTTAQLFDYTRYYPGQWLDIPQSLKYVDPPGYKAGAQPFVETLHALLRKAGVKWNAPEWLATASGADMAAYTASLTAESPFVRSIESEQVSYKAAYRRSLWIAVENYIKFCSGNLLVPIRDGDRVVGQREYTLDQVRRLVTIQVEAKGAQVRNKLEEVQANVARLQAGWKSPQTIQQEEGLNTDRELTNLEEWQERTGGPGTPLELPGDEGNPGDGDSAGGGKGGLQQPELQKLQKLMQPKLPSTPPPKLPTAESREVRESAEPFEIDEQLWWECQAVFPNAVPEQLPAEIGTIDNGVRIFLVDGTKVKIEPDQPGDVGPNGGHMDFTLAGNDCEAPWIRRQYGERSIIVDARVTRVEWAPNCFHEANERRFMVTGMDYGTAHDRTNPLERCVRLRLQKATPSLESKEPAEDEDDEERAILIAETLYGLFGEKAKEHLGA